MAKTKNGAVYDTIIEKSERIFYNATFAALDAIAEEKVKNVRLAARKMGREFFRTLAKDYMRVPAPGSFGWADLSPKWDKRKRSRNRNAYRKVYYGISPQLGLGAHLREEMSKKNANVLFGSPKIKVKAASDLTGVEGKIVPIESLPGRYQFAAGSTRRMDDGTIKKIGGRFVTPSARVTVELFPRILNLTAPEIFDAMRRRSRDLGPMTDGGGGDNEDGEGEGSKRGNWIQRLAGNEFGTALGGVVPARPLLAPFMRWWLQNTGFTRIEEALK